MSTIARKSERRREAKKEGLCSNCLCRPASDGKLYCLVCREKRSEMAIVNNLKRRVSGFCILCCKNTSKKGLKICEECSNKKKELYKKNKESIKQRILNAISSGICTDCFREKAIFGRRCCELCAEGRRKYNNSRKKKLKLKILEEYGKSQCACCGESKVGFLTLDHKYNDGAEHRKSINLSSGEKFYSYLKKNGFPDKDRLQVLCYNCNLGRDKTEDKVCPHKKANLFEYGDGI